MSRKGCNRGGCRLSLWATLLRPAGRHTPCFLRYIMACKVGAGRAYTARRIPPFLFLEWRLWLQCQGYDNIIILIHTKENQSTKKALFEHYCFFFSLIYYNEMRRVFPPPP